VTEPTLPPEAAELLAKMHDIAEPGPISWWPLAPGWWVLIITAIVSVALLIRWRLRRIAANRYRKEALRLLTQLEANVSATSIADVVDIIKRTALQAYPHDRAIIARSYGKTWVDWLNRQCKVPVFDETAADALSQAAYRAPSNEPGEPESLRHLLSAARAWIHQHRSSPASASIQHA
jgi:Domain of unknown function (DUF4381)